MKMRVRGSRAQINKVGAYCMKIVVLVKQTPDTAELPSVSAEDVAAGDIQAEMVLNPWDEYAVEEAVQLGDRYDVDSVALSVGDPQDTGALKHALAVGIDAATLVDAGPLAGGDAWTIAAALCAAILAEGEVDLVLTGRQSVDGNSGAVQVGVARKLGWPLLTNVTKIVAVEDGRITVERLGDGVQQTVSVPLPAVVSVSKEINEPSYPSFMGIRKANKADIPVLDPVELGVSVQPRTTWENIRKPETRAPEVQIIEGDTPSEKAAKLLDALLAEKVL